jgi:hypothetical protein
MDTHSGKAACGKIVSSDGNLDGFYILLEGQVLDVLRTLVLTPIFSVKRCNCKVPDIYFNDRVEL